MPRDIGTGLYHYPDGTPGNPGQTIFSTRYNTFINDLTNTLNQPLPINMGGTGASSGDAALTNLPAEKAAQLVSSYDTHLWMPGSFRSAAAATSAPNNTSSFVGTAYVNEALVNPPTNQNVVLEARDQNDTTIPGRTYVREKKAGVWGPWTGGIYAAPFDAMAYNGMQMNGSMEVSQERGVSGTSTDGQHICDGWVLGRVGTMVVTGVAEPTLYVNGIGGLIYAPVATAQPSLGAGDFAVIVQRIEGYRTLRLGWGTSAAQPITIAFWTGHARAGVYSGSLRNGSGTRSYAFTYTQAAASVSQYNTITIPGCTDGVWGAGNSNGISLAFAIACGSTFVAPSTNTWVAGSYFAAPGQVNGVATTADVFRITGVVVLPGTQAPTAAQSPLIMRPYDQELLLCQRYFTKTSFSFSGYKNNGNGVSLRIPIAPVMRVSPTILVTYTGDAGWDGTITRTAIPYFAGIGFTPTSSGGFILAEDWNLDARL